MQRDVFTILICQPVLDGLTSQSEPLKGDSERECARVDPDEACDEDGPLCGGEDTYVISLPE